MLRYLMLLTLPVCALAQTEPPTYRYVNLHPEGYPHSCAWGLAPTGNVAGFAMNNPLLQFPMAAVADVPIILDTLTYGYGSARALNSAGFAAGWIYNMPNPTDSAAVTWNLVGGGAPTVLDIPTWAIFTRAVDINDTGTVCGWATDEQGDAHAGIWDGSGWSAVSIPNSVRSGARAISPSGIVAGFTRQLDGSERAFRWNGALVVLTQDVGGIDSQDVNDSALVVGTSDAGGFYWEPTTLNPALLAPLEPGGFTNAFGLNQQGCVVGVATSGVDDVAVIWQDVDSTPARLDGLAVIPSNINLLVAYDINDAGDIVGMARNSATLQYSAFALRPLSGGGG